MAHEPAAPAMGEDVPLLKVQGVSKSFPGVKAEQPYKIFKTLAAEGDFNVRTIYQEVDCALSFSHATF